MTTLAERTDQEAREAAACIGGMSGVYRDEEDRVQTMPDLDGSA